MLRSRIVDTREVGIDVIQEVDVGPERLVVPNSFDLMILRDVAVHAEHEEPAALLAIIRKNEWLAETEVACSEWVDRPPERRCRTDAGKNARDGRVDRAGKTIRSSEIEDVD